MWRGGQVKKISDKCIKLKDQLDEERRKVAALDPKALEEAKVGLAWLGS